MLFRSFLFVILLLAQKTSAQEDLFEPMFIEESEASYEDVLKAAESFHSYDFDEGLRTLGFPTSDYTMGGYRGIAQYNVAMFRGIRYAHAERFQKPEKVKTLDGEVDAYSKGPSCPQPSSDFFENAFRYSEDCLFLDVYVPLRKTILVEEGSEPKVSELVTEFEELPIIIAFQGDEFTYAESKKHDGRFMARFGTAIVVIVNYRTGVLGFLSSGNDHIPGNYGLYDQKMAIEWVKSHAEYFGGNTEKITLLGFSSGAESVSAQMTNPDNSKDLFQRVILQSGVSKPGTLFANDKEAEMLAQQNIFDRILEFSECDVDPVECLKYMDIEKLISTAGALTFDRKDNRTFGPVHDEYYFTETEEELIGQYDIMIGVVENEAGKWLGGIADNVTLYSVIKHLFASNSYFHCAPEYLVNFLDFEYRAHSEIDKFKAVQRGFLKLVSDYDYVAPAITFANRAAMSGAQTYVYEFQAAVASTDPGKPEIVIGRPVHGDDQNFVFGFPLILSKYYPSSTRNVSANYLGMITNFAHTGNPDEGPNQIPSHLPSWEAYSEDYMGTYIISEEMEMKYKYFARTLSTWTSVVTYMMSDEFCGEKEIEPTEAPTTKPSEPTTGSTEGPTIEPTEIPTVEPTSCGTPEPTSYYFKQWKEDYMRWKNEYIPRWKMAAEKYEQLAEKLEAGGCEKDKE